MHQKISEKIKIKKIGMVALKEFFISHKKAANVWHPPALENLIYKHILCMHIDLLY